MQRITGELSQTDHTNAIKSSLVITNARDWEWEPPSAAQKRDSSGATYTTVLSFNLRYSGMESELG